MQNLRISSRWVGGGNPEVLTEYAHKEGVSKCVVVANPAVHGSQQHYTLLGTWSFFSPVQHRAGRSRTLWA